MEASTIARSTRGWPQPRGEKEKEKEREKERERERDALIEGHTDAKFSAPNDMAGQIQSIVRDNQCELRRDADLARHFERSSGKRDVAHRAINRTADELNHCGFHDAEARCYPGFDHLIPPIENRVPPLSPGIIRASWPAPSQLFLIHKIQKTQRQSKWRS